MEKIAVKELRDNLKFVWIFSKSQKRKLIFYGIFDVLIIIMGVGVPILSAKVIIYLTENQYSKLLFLAVVILGVEITRNIIRYFVNYFSQIIYRESFIKIQTSIGSELLKIENAFLDKTGTGVFIQRITNDTSKMADVFSILNIYLTRIFMEFGIFIAIFFIHKIIFLYVMIMLTLIYCLDRIRVKKISEKDKKFRSLTEIATTFVGELVRGSRDIKMLNAETNFTNELECKIKNVNQSRYQMGAIDRIYSFFLLSIQDLFHAGLIFLLVYLITQNQLEVASAIIILNYSTKVLNIVDYISIFMEKLKDFNLSTKRIRAIFSEQEFPKEKFGQIHFNKVSGDFAFHNVSFRYNKKDVLKDINFEVKKNTTVAFVGKSGAGKSTIFHLLCKMYNVTSGEITIDGINIQSLDKESIRGNITIINQSPYIFNLSVRDNLRLVKENVTEEEMIEACKLACLHDFIIGMTDGYDTVLGEGGINLSGGQKQRLAIARALLQKTEIILFDEATSALDNETQASIKKAMDNLKKDYTILIIAHRLSTIIDSDCILFLNDGKIESSGTHEQLMSKSENYRKLYNAELVTDNT